MFRSRSWPVWLAAGLALACGLVWRFTRGDRPSLARAAPAPAAAGEREPSPAALELAPVLAAREEVDAPVPPVAAGAAATGEAILVLQVLAQETGEPLAGLDLYVDERLASSGDASFWTVSSVSRVDITDARGRLAFQVQAGKPHEFELVSIDASRAGSAHLEIPALAPGERREVTVRLASSADVAWFGRILDGTSQAPLADARVELVAGNPFTDHSGRATAVSAADGIVALAFQSWRPIYARIELEGYAPGFVQLGRGHERPSSACPVRLLRAGTLELVVTDPGGLAREGLDVRVSADPWERIQGDTGGEVFSAPPFEARTDVRGGCVLAGLPPDMPLSLEVLESGLSLRREERTLRFEPGEVRRLEWTVGGRCTLRGRTLDEDGGPAEGVSVWLIPDLNGVLRDFTHDEVTAKARSGPDGDFTMEVAAGTWRIGLAPEQSGARSASGPLVDIACAMTTVVIAPAQSSAEVTLTCWHGLFLSGVVLDPEGARVSAGHVSVWDEAMSRSLMADLKDGAFSIGPLAAGSYRVRAVSDDPTLSDLEPHLVAAGTTGIEIVLRRGSGLSVRVLDARGDPAAGQLVWILSAAGGKYGNRIRSDASGRVKFDSLPPGTFSLSTSTAAGEFALERGVTLGAGSAPRELELRLVPARRVRIEVQHGPHTPLQDVIFLDGDPIAVMFLDESPVTALAPGEYEIELWGDSDKALQRQRVRVTPDGETRAVFDLAAPR
jgi:hypothetical protein